MIHTISWFPVVFLWKQGSHNILDCPLWADLLSMEKSGTSLSVRLCISCFIVLSVPVCWWNACLFHTDTITERIKFYTDFDHIHLLICIIMVEKYEKLQSFWKYITTSIPTVYLFVLETPGNWISFQKIR